MLHHLVQRQLCRPTVIPKDVSKQRPQILRSQIRLVVLDIIHTSLCEALQHPIGADDGARLGVEQNTS